MQNPENLLADIRAVFEEAATPQDAPPMAAYMKNRVPFLGLKAPARRLLQKEIFALYKALPFAETEKIIRLLWTQPEREFQYLALDWLWLRRKDFSRETILLIETLLTTKSGWDTVDFLSSQILGYWAKTFPEAARPVIARFIQSPDFWLSRAAIIHQLFYKEKTDTALLTAALLPHLLSKEFFLRKAIGWALRQYARTDAAWVISFVEAHPEMSGLSKREATKRLQTQTLGNRVAAS